MNSSEGNRPSPEQNRARSTIDIKGLDKALVLAALYNGARPQGAGFFRYDPTPMTVEEATAVLKKSTYFDYLKGRVMKIDLSGDEVDSRPYDMDNGEGSARTFIDSLREGENPDPNNPTIRGHHLAQAGEQAQITRELLHEDPSGFKGPQTYHLGFDGIADKLSPRVIEAQEAIRRLRGQK